MTQNIMENEALGFNSNSSEKITKLVEIIKKAAGVTHTILLARFKSKKAEEVIESNNKLDMWEVLQEYFRQYATFINRLTFITNIYICEVPSDYYNSVTADDIAEQLRMVISFVYVKEFADSAAKSALKDMVKSMLPNCDIFTKEELKFIL